MSVVTYGLALRSINIQAENNHRDDLAHVLRVDERFDFITEQV